MRLDKTDMSLYGMCPETDLFYAIVCSFCSAVIKPEGLSRHIYNHHRNSSISFTHQHSSTPELFSNSENVHNNSPVACSTSETEGSADCGSILSSFYTSTASNLPQEVPLTTSQQGHLVVSSNDLCNKANSSMAPPVSCASFAPLLTKSKSRISGSSNKFKTKNCKLVPISSTTPLIATTIPLTAVSSTSSSIIPSKGPLMSTNSNVPSLSLYKSNKKASKVDCNDLPTANKFGFAPDTFNSPNLLLHQQTTRIGAMTENDYMEVTSDNIPADNEIASIPITVCAEVMLTNSTTPLVDVFSSTTALQSSLVSTKHVPCRKRMSTERKYLPIKDREYDPNTHCGVIIQDSGKPCTRSLTCKSHALSLRRQVPGRLMSFDKLLANHRLSKDSSNSSVAMVCSPFFIYFFFFL